MPAAMVSPAAGISFFNFFEKPVFPVKSAFLEDLGEAGIKKFHCHRGIGTAIALYRGKENTEPCFWI